MQRIAGHGTVIYDDFSLPSVWIGFFLWCHVLCVYSNRYGQTASADVTVKWINLLFSGHIIL